MVARRNPKVPCRNFYRIFPCKLWGKHELDFKEITKMIKEIDRNCQRQAFKNKRNMLKAIAYGDTKIKNNTRTEITPTEV